MNGNLWKLGALSVVTLALMGCAKEISKPVKDNTKPVAAPTSQEITLDPSKVPMQSYFPMKSGRKLSYARSHDMREDRVELTYGSPTQSGANTVIVGTSRLYPADKKQKMLTATERTTWVPGKGLYIMPGENAGLSGYGLKVLPAVWKGSGSRWQEQAMRKAQNGAMVNVTFDGIVDGPEVIPTPAGDFQAIHSEITVTGRMGTQTDVRRYEFWFSPDVGMVKYLERAPNTGAISVLLTKK